MASIVRDADQPEPLLTLDASESYSTISKEESGSSPKASIRGLLSRKSASMCSVEQFPQRNHTAFGG